MSDWATYLYFGISGVATLVVTGITLYAWRHRQVSSARAFALLLTCATVLIWNLLFRNFVSPETPLGLFTFSITMVSIIVLPLAWLLFALDYGGHTAWLTRRRALALSVIPALSLSLYLSNSLHHSFYRTFNSYRVGMLVFFDGIYGPWFYVHSVYSYTLMLVGAILLVRFALRTFRLYRFQALLLVMGACSVLIPNILSTFKITRLSYMPVGFTVMALLYSQAIFRYRLLNLAPVARHTLVDGMSDGMLVVDIQEDIVDLNPAMAQFLGVPVNVPIGRPVWEFLPYGVDWESWLRAPTGTQASLAHTGVEGPRAYDVRVSPLHDRQGRVSGRLLVLHDVTERQQGAEALERYAQELEARNVELDAFAHTVAHDLKNPLSAVVGYGAFLLNRYDKTDDEQRLSMLEIITRQGKRMTRIIDELLLLASLRKLGDVTFGPLDMGQIVAEVQERLALAIDEKQAQITLPEGWPTALGYAAWVEEIWTNYLSNALKYGGNPPRVELGYDILSAETSSSPSPASSNQQPAVSGAATTSIKFWVRDNGVGLSPEEQSRLFTPFTRLDQVSAKGYGLGLSIVRRISEKLGGQVGVESAPGTGSTFWFTLPAPSSGKMNETSTPWHHQPCES